MSIVWAALFGMAVNETPKSGKSHKRVVTVKGMGFKSLASGVAEIESTSEKLGCGRQ